MAFDFPGFDLGCIVANADLSAAQYKAVKIINSSGVAKVDVCSAAGEYVDGVLQNKPVAGEVCVVRLDRVSLVRTGAAVNPGDKLKTDASGRYIVAAAGTTNTGDAGGASDPLVGSFVSAIALEAASAADQYIAAAVVHMGAIPTTAA